MVVSNISSGAGSVVVGAPGLAKDTFDLGHGLDEPVRLLQQLGRFWDTEIPGSADGMYCRSPSSSGGMNSPPSRRSGTAVMANASAAIASVALESQHGLQRRRYRAMSHGFTGFAVSRGMRPRMR